MPKHPGIPQLTLHEVEKIFNKIKTMVPFHLELAGSARRKMDKMNDIDILLVTNKDIKEVIPHISPLYVKITRQGDRIISGICQYNNKPVILEIFIVKKKELPYALLHFTGPRTYNMRIRRFVRDQHGWLLNQYGIFYANNPEKRVTNTIKTEKDIINFIGTHYYKPEDRK